MCVDEGKTMALFFFSFLEWKIIAEKTVSEHIVNFDLY